MVIEYLLDLNQTTRMRATRLIYMEGGLWSMAILCSMPCMSRLKADNLISAAFFGIVECFIGSHEQ